MFDLGSTVVAAKSLVAADLGDEVAMLQLDSGQYYGLNPVGRRVWQLLRSPTTGQAIVDLLCAEYEVEPERCRQDVQAMLGELLKERLIEVGDAPVA